MEMGGREGAVERWRYFLKEGVEQTPWARRTDKAQRWEGVQKADIAFWFRATGQWGQMFFPDFPSPADFAFYSRVFPSMSMICH